MWPLLKAGKYLVWDLPSSAIRSCCRSRPRRETPSDADFQSRRRLAVRSDSRGGSDSEGGDDRSQGGPDGLVASLVLSAGARRDVRHSRSAGPSVIRRRLRDDIVSSSAASVVTADDVHSKSKTASVSCCDTLTKPAWHLVLGGINSIKTSAVIMFSLVLIMQQQGVDEETFVENLEKAFDVLVYLGIANTLASAVVEDSHHTDWLLETLEKSAAWIYLWLQDIPGGFRESLIIGGVFSGLVALLNIDPDNGVKLLNETAGNRVTTVRSGLMADPRGDGDCLRQSWRFGSRILNPINIAALNYFLIRWSAYYAGDQDRNSTISLGVGAVMAAQAFARAIVELSFGRAESATDLQNSIEYRYARISSSISQAIVTFTQVLEFMPHFIAWVAKNWVDSQPPEMDLLEFSVWSALTYGTATLAAVIAVNDTLQLDRMIFRFTAMREVVDVAGTGDIPLEAELVSRLQAAHTGKGGLSVKPRVSCCASFFRLLTAPAVELTENTGVEDISDLPAASGCRG